MPLTMLDAPQGRLIARTNASVRNPRPQIVTGFYRLKGRDTAVRYRFVGMRRNTDECPISRNLPTMITTSDFAVVDATQ